MLLHELDITGRSRTSSAFQDLTSLMTNLFEDDTHQYEKKDVRIPHSGKFDSKAIRSISIGGNQAVSSCKTPQ